MTAVTEPAGGTRRDRFTISLYLLLAGVAILHSGLGALLPYMRHDLRMSHVVESVHLSAMAVGGLVASVLAGPVRRKLGRGRLLLCAGLLVAAGGVGFAVATTPTISVASAFLVGLGGSVCLISGQAALVGLHGPRSARMIIELNLAYSLGAALGTAALPLVAGSGLGWRGFGGLHAVLLCLVVVPLMLGTARSADPPAVPPRRAASGVRRGRPAFGVVAAALSVAVEWSFALWVATYLHDVVGLDRAQASWGTSLMLTGVIAGRAAGSRMVARVAPQHVLTGSLLTCGLAFGLLNASHSTTAVVGAAAVAGLGIANLYPAAVAMVIGGDPSRADTAMARCSLATSTSLMISPVLLGWLADSVGLARAFTVVPVFVVGALAAIRLAGGPRPAARSSMPSGRAGVG
ncbi:MFS transporter [Microtetraspora fusca]|uniref:MFS transporter n=1 Tax=Microtetraspora fusca TaxID=1997 RepID=A0ABW6VAP0_MICFU